MHRYVSFALSCVPEPGSDLAVLGKHWFGWDVDSGTESALLNIEKLPRAPLALIGRHRRFGFQAPILAPFRLARGHSPLDLHHTVRAIADYFGPIKLPALRMARRRAGLCIVPLRGSPELRQVATTVRGVFDRFCAPPARSARSTPPRAACDMPSEAPFELQFQITDGLLPAEQARVFSILRPIIEPNLPRPFVIRSLTLLGEDQHGWFRKIQRYPLGGTSRVRGLQDDLAPPLTGAPLSW